MQVPNVTRKHPPGSSADGSDGPVLQRTLVSDALGAGWGVARAGPTGSKPKAHGQTWFYPARHLVSALQQCPVLAYLSTSSYIYTVLKLHSAL